MKIEFGINPNCSDATMRIDLTGQNSKKIEQLIKELRIRLSGDYKQRPGEWDGEEENTDPWSEGYIDRKRVFGIDALVITGDAPYNFGEEIGNVIKEYLPKVRIEYDV